MSKSKIFTFGDEVEGFNFKVLDERAVRASAGIMFLIGLFAFINGRFLQNYHLLPYFAGFMLINFFIGVLINPRFAPTYFIGRLMVSSQKPLYVGAIQKRFAWSLGMIMAASAVFVSLNLGSDPIFLPILMVICLVCISLMFVETAFGICLGCKFYYLAIKLKLIKEPEHKPNCIGDSCKL